MDQQSDSPKYYWHTIDDHWSKYDIDPLLFTAPVYMVAFSSNRLCYDRCDLGRTI